MSEGAPGSSHRLDTTPSASPTSNHTRKQVDGIQDWQSRTGESILNTLVHVVIVPDKFKGTLTAKQAASAIAQGWKRIRPGDNLECIPMSDGGDGFGAVFSALLGAGTRRVTTVDAAQHPLRTRWWWEPATRTAIIEAAEVIGLARLARQHPHPFELDTTGLGRVLQAASRLNPRRCLIGIGGSATNDGGFGLARALGWRFLTSGGAAIGRWPDLSACGQIIAPIRRLKLGTLTVVVDVQNPLLGATGCTRVYGPQKGLRPMDFERAEQALRGMASTVKRQYAESLAMTPGAGAAGGLGFGLMTFLKARPVTGFSLFAREASLNARIRTADLVVTGEGRLDVQSLMGKGVGELLRLCERHDVPCMALSGNVDLPPSAKRRFAGTHSVASLAGARQALSVPRCSLAKAAAHAAAALGGRHVVKGK